MAEISVSLVTRGAQSLFVCLLSSQGFPMDPVAFQLDVLNTSGTSHGTDSVGVQPHCALLDH